MSGRLVMGITLMAVGVLFLLGALGVVDGPGAILRAWWPLVFVLLGAALAFEQRRVRYGPLLFVVLGLVLLAATTDVVPLDARAVWPLALIVAGGWLLLRPRDGAGRVRVDGSTIEVTSVFGDRTVHGDAVPLERASLNSVFGDLDVNLSASQATDDMAVDIAVLFGDVDLAVPASWRIALSPTSVVGDVKHLPPPQAATADAPLVRVRGFTVFGDITVRQ